MDFAEGVIEAFVGPTELGAADDLEAVIVDFIAAAEHSLDVAVQEVDSLPIAQALIDARWRGVAVRVVLEQDYLQDRQQPRATPRAGETEEQARIRVQWRQDPPRELDINRDILAALLRNRVHVSADYNPDIFHQKFIVRDYRRGARPRSALLTGSANFTHTDTHTNLNHLVIFHDPQVCNAYAVEFAQLNAGDFGRGQQGDVPRTVNLGGVPVKVLFAPNHSPELELVKQILKSRQRIDFAVFTFSGSSGVDDALILARRAGRQVRGVLDPGQAAQDWAATRWLDDAEVELFLPNRQPPFRKLHHKLTVIDDATVVAGSFNYTAPANDYNDENLFVLGSPHLDLPDNQGGPVDPYRCAQLTGFFRAEIDRIITAGNLYKPPERPPEL
ncbi:MAG: phospholipase D-like domain-containing protein [Egibacteraceae bacterium]